MSNESLEPSAPSPRDQRWTHRHAPNLMSAALLGLLVAVTLIQVAC